MPDGLEPIVVRHLHEPIGLFEIELAVGILNGSRLHAILRCDIRKLRSQELLLGFSRSGIGAQTNSELKHALRRIHQRNV